MEEKNIATILERPRPTLFAATLIVLIATLGLWVGSFAALMIAPRSGIAQEVVVNVVYYLPFVALPLALYMRRHRGLSDALRLNPMPLLPTLTVALLAVVSVFAASALDSLWMLLLGAVGLEAIQPSLTIGTSRELTIHILNTAALPAVCEEFLFRGFVLSAWESRGTRLAVWVSAVLFSMMHANLFGLPAYLLVGLVSGFLVFALDTLYAGIVYHTVYNATILALLYVASANPGLAQASGGVQAVSYATELLMSLTFMAAMLLSVNMRRRLTGIGAVPRIREPLARRERALLVALLAVMLGAMAAALLPGGIA